MEIVTQIIHAALNELFERGVIDLPPEEMEQEEIAAFRLKCEIDYGPGRKSIMVMSPDWVVFVREHEGKYEAYFSVERERVTA
jgi:hypothetical protein